MTIDRNRTTIPKTLLGDRQRRTSPEERRSLHLPRGPVAHHARKKAASSDVGGRGKSANEGLFSRSELDALASEYENGITAVQIVELFAARGVRFSEATFRKYVQQGLLPRSRRVGRKGKHRGSLGVYPAKVVERINTIKAMMEEGLTIEEIQEQILRFTDVVERIEEGIRDALELFEEDLTSPRFDVRTRKSLKKELADAESCADELLKRVQKLSQRLTESHEDSYRSTGAAGSAEDLL